MRTLDETDFEIRRLLTEDARKPYREIAGAVDLSSPSVSDRVSRLQEMGTVRRFTLELDYSKLRGGVPVLVELSVRPDAVEEIQETLVASDTIELHRIFRLVIESKRSLCGIKNGLHWH